MANSYESLDGAASTVRNAAMGSAVVYFMVATETVGTPMEPYIETGFVGLTVVAGLAHAVACFARNRHETSD